MKRTATMSCPRTRETADASRKSIVQQKHRRGIGQKSRAPIATTTTHHHDAIDPHLIKVRRKRKSSNVWTAALKASPRTKPRHPKKNARKDRNKNPESAQPAPTSTGSSALPCTIFVPTPHLQGGLCTGTRRYLLDIVPSYVAACDIVPSYTARIRMLASRCFTSAI